MASWSATGSINGNYRLELNVWENWNSMDNYSSVHWEVILRATGNYSFSTIGSTIVVNVDGEVYNAYSQNHLVQAVQLQLRVGIKTYGTMQMEQKQYIVVQAILKVLVLHIHLAI